ncbi:hypothetical protein [Caldimonas tepidiphila]|uniref:hypothetical protein n=1 Tax=Caldimonas tepidiphila TaxID=2315841 RepID=UPI000E5BB69A|nr:hypothetical protein [Caldimonas tepidiphila]
MSDEQRPCAPRPGPATAPGPRLRHRRNLIIVRAGDRSLHREWTAGEDRDFDLFVSYYGSKGTPWLYDGEYHEHRPGPKWPCLAELLAEQPELIERYDAFWLPDDDISASTEVIDRMFALFHGFGLALAQPALTRDSYYSWDFLLQRPECVLRHTRFVEVMVPIFGRGALRACLPSFAESHSGWGLDWLWPHLCDDGRPERFAILDATPVRHTRPLGGELYRNNPALDPRRDEQRLLEKYGLGAVRVTGKYEAVTSAVRRVGLPISEQIWQGLRRLNALRRERRHRHSSPQTPPPGRNPS